MKTTKQLDIDEAGESGELAAGDPLLPLVNGQSVRSLANSSPAAVVIGELVGLTDEGRTPLVVYPGQVGSAAIPARSTVDLHGGHIGKQLVLMLEGADSGTPIVVGVLRDSQGSLDAEQPGRIEVDVDGDRMVVRGKRQVVLRCGKASITLTQDGKILIQGTYLSSHSTGVNRIKGGSVQIN
jgi:hypothetical protein